MKRMLLALILSSAATASFAGTVSVPTGEVPKLVLPGAALGQSAAPGLILPQTGPALSLAPAPTLIIPDAPKLVTPGPMIIPAVRAMTPEELNPAKPATGDELKKLVESLAPKPEAAGDDPAHRAEKLDAAFDGALAPEAKGWSDVSEEFSQGPLSPGLPSIETAARSLIARLLPPVDRRVPTHTSFDRSPKPTTGHTWTPETGHRIEMAPVAADLKGEVASAFGDARVTQKIERLVEWAHEYFHVLFDSAVRREENHAPHSVYSAMTEGFAVSGEQLLLSRMIDSALPLGLGARDAMDLNAIAGARSRWLDVSDNHYSEGILAWRDAYEKGGARGLLEFLSSLSARRMAATPRSDAAYQLALGDHALLAAYMGRDDSADRRGLDAFGKAVRGEKLTIAEALEARTAVEKAGPDGWRRLFERTLLVDKRIKEPKPAAEAGAKWWEKKEARAPSVAPVFVLAKLSPAAAAELARFLATTIAERGGAARLFDTPGPNEKTTAIIAGAETLPWDEASRAAWNDGLGRWLMSQH